LWKKVFQKSKIAARISLNPAAKLNKLKQSFTVDGGRGSYTLKKAKRKFWNTQFVLSTHSKINQKQSK
jgi:hypothetical protein